MPRHAVVAQHTERPQHIGHACPPRQGGGHDRRKREQAVGVNGVEALNVGVEPPCHSGRRLEEDRVSWKVPARGMPRRNRLAALNGQFPAAAVIIGGNGGHIDAAHRQRTFDVDNGATGPALRAGNGRDDVQNLHPLGHSNLKPRPPRRARLLDRRAPAQSSGWRRRPPPAQCAQHRAYRG